MNINGKHFETISITDGREPVVQVIDQTLLPFRFENEGTLYGKRCIFRHM